MRTLISLSAGLFFAMPLLAAPPAGSWKFRTILNDRPVTMMVAFSQTDGKWVCDFIDSRPALNREPKVTGVQVNGNAVKFTLSIAGREFISFDGTVAKDGKKLTGSFSQLGGPLQLIEIQPTKLKKLDDPFEINRELFEQVESTTPELFDFGLEILPMASVKKLSPEDVRGMVDRMTKAAAAYGPRWDRYVALKMAGALVDQAGYAEIALVQARRAERMLADNDPIGDRMEVLDLLNRALVKSNKADEAKPIATQIVRLEARDFAEYLKSSPNGEVAEFKGRKAKSNRVVLVEAFAGCEFPLSLPIEQSVDGLLKAYKPTDVLVLNYHFHLPDPAQGDPLTVPETIERLTPLVEQVQKGFFVYVAGKAGPKSTTPTAGKELFDALKKSVDEQLEKPAGCQLTLAVAKGMKGFDVKANVADLEVGSNKLALRFAVIEPKIRLAGASGARFHQNVVRAIPGGGKGFPLTKKQTEQVVNVDPEAIRASLSKYLTDFTKGEGEFPRAARPLDLKNLKVVAFVQNDSTGEILTAATVDLDAK
ncbi:MAG: hypothetical protein U0798_11410 [Gemmataceae bacterium]